MEQNVIFCSLSNRSDIFTHLVQKVIIGANKHLLDEIESNIYWMRSSPTFSILCPDKAILGEALKHLKCWYVNNCSDCRSF